MNRICDYTIYININLILPFNFNLTLNHNHTFLVDVIELSFGTGEGGGLSHHRAVGFVSLVQWNRDNKKLFDKCFG